jgi:predicted homoserine dehydrogenase-like protein
MIKSLVLVCLLAQAAAFTAGPVQRASTALLMNIESQEVKKDIKVGVIGMGRIGLVHLEAITKAPGVRPVIVSNPTVSKAEAGVSNKQSGSSMSSVDMQRNATQRNE